MLREVSVSFYWGGGVRGVREHKTLASYQVVQVSANNRQSQCTLYASVVRPEQDLGYGKQTKRIKANTRTEEEVCVYVRERLCIHADYKCTLSCKHGEFLRRFVTFNAPPLYKTQKASVHLL